MAILEATLATELENLVPTATAPEAVQAMADAYGVYMSDAVCNGITILSVSALVTAMAGAMSFPNTGSAADAGAAFQAGVVAFWAAMVAAPATYFTAAIGITVPPNLSTLGTALASTFGSNLTKSLEDSAAAMAADIHTVSLGGFGVFTGPVSFPIL